METHQLTKEQILSFLRENKDFFKKEFDVDAIILFGSYTTNFFSTSLLSKTNFNYLGHSVPQMWSAVKLTTFP